MGREREKERERERGKGEDTHLECYNLTIIPTVIVLPENFNVPTNRLVPFKRQFCTKIPFGLSTKHFDF